MGVMSKISKLLRPLRNVKDRLISEMGKAFDEYLLFTNIFSSIILMEFGDFMQQEVEFHQYNITDAPYDYLRTARMGAVGVGYGIFHHYFYTGLDKIWPTPNLACTAKKILADQLTMSPVCIIYFFYCAGLLEGKNFSECTDEMMLKFWSVYLFDWMLWPPTQVINFLYVPVKYQVFYINTITVFYDIFLSYIKHKEVVQLEVLEEMGSDPYDFEDFDDEFNEEQVVGKLEDNIVTEKGDEILMPSKKPPKK